MGRLLGTFILPHPPIIVPEIGMGREKEAEKTIEEVKKVAKKIKELNPKTIIITTPHNINFSDYIYISDANNLNGDFLNFECNDINLEFKNDNELLSKIVEFSNREHIAAGPLETKLMKKYNIEKKLDHGALVPLYFIKKELPDFKIVHISLAGFNTKYMYRFGKCISEAIDQLDGEYVFVASGDLSHKVNEKSHYGYSKFGKEFDDFLLNSLNDNKIYDILNIDDAFCEKAAQCGLKSIVIMLGALDKFNYKLKINSYEAPFGIGYAVVTFSDLEKSNNKKKVLERANDEYIDKINNIRSKEHKFVKLARESLEYYLNHSKIMEVPNNIDKYLLENKAGVFVSIKKDGGLRGCIGTISPQRSSIAEEIIHNAVSSGVNDFRFAKVDVNELEYLVYSVDILKEPCKINSISELDVKKYGVIVRSSYKSGLLLPNLEGIDTTKEQVKIALDKAGISENEKYSMERFEVIRYK